MGARLVWWMIPALLLATVGGVEGSGYHDGYREDGYVYRGGYFWKGNQAYSRSKVYTGYEYGPYGTTYHLYRWDYSPVYVAPPAPASYAPTPPVYEEGWEKAIVKYNAKRLDYAAFLEAMRQSGIDGTQYDFQRSRYSYAAAPSGQTQYGYTYNSVKEQYGTLNPNELYQQAYRLAEQAQGNGSKAASEFQQSINLTGEQLARVAEIRESGAVARAILSELKQSRTVERTTITGVGNGKGVVGPADPAPAPTPKPMLPAGAAAEFMREVGTPLCASCHGEADPKGKFRISTYPSMSLEERSERVWPKLTTTNDVKKMPRTPDGKPGTITLDQLNRFLTLPVQ